MVRWCGGGPDGKSKEVEGGFVPAEFRLERCSSSASAMPSRCAREDPVNYSCSVYPRTLERQARVFCGVK
jgi:hypothetical protein